MVAPTVQRIAECFDFKFCRVKSNWILSGKSAFMKADVGKSQEKQFLGVL